MIFEQIERRQQRLAAVSATSAAPDRRVLSAAQVATVRAFLADLRTGWGDQPASLRNEFLRLDSGSGAWSKLSAVPSK